MSSSAYSGLCTVVAVSLKIACPATICLRSLVKTIARSDLFRNFFRRTSVEALLATSLYGIKAGGCDQGDSPRGSYEACLAIEQDWISVDPTMRVPTFGTDILPMTCGLGARIAASAPPHHRLRFELHAPYLFHSKLDLLFQGKHLSRRGSAPIDDGEGVFV